MSTQLANFYVFVPPNKVQRPYAFQFLILLPGLSFFLDVHRVILLRAFAFALYTTLRELAEVRGARQLFERMPIRPSNFNELTKQSTHVWKTLRFP